MMIITV